MSFPISGMLLKRRDVWQQSIRSMFCASSSVQGSLEEAILDHSISPAVYVPFSSKGFSIDGDNVPEDFGSGREEVHDGMHDGLEMEGFGDEDEGVEGGDDTEDVGMLPHGRGRGRPPRSRNFNHRWRATCPWLMHIHHKIEFMDI